MTVARPRFPRALFLSVAFFAAAGTAGWILWPRPPTRTSLLLITLDTTRADRLGCYGYAAARTPNLDALAQSGVVFDRAFTVVPITLPAHVSLMTGRYPVETGVHRNGRERLGNDIPTLAALLKKNGYDTGAFVGSFVLDSKFGLDRGFNHYDDDVGGLAAAEDDRRRPASSVVDAALSWLGRKRNAPTFCWVHFYDPHAPVTSHRELFGEEFSERPYDAEIAYVDRQIGRILQFLKSRGLEKQTLIAVVGDHGEGLGEHYEKSHSLTLYNSTLRIPLIVRQPQALPADRRIAENVSLVDLFPTFLDLLQLQATAEITGHSLEPALRSGEWSPSLCYGETEEPFDVYGCSKLHVLVDGDWKYIRTARPELYDLAADPDELTNLIEQEPEKAREMESRLAELESGLSVNEAPKVELTSAERRTLASLGYASGGAQPDDGADPSRLPDIKDILPLEEEMETAVKLFNDGAEDPAIERFRKIIAQAPTHAPACWSLAWSLWKQSKRDEAMTVLRDLAAVRPLSHTAHYGLGYMLLQLDRLDEAIPEFVAAIDIDPGHAESHFHLAESMLATGRVNEARLHLNETLQIEPGHLPAIQLMHFIQVNLPRIDAAVVDYRKALRQASDLSATTPPNQPLLRQ